MLYLHTQICFPEAYSSLQKLDSSFSSVFFCLLFVLLFVVVVVVVVVVVCEGLEHLEMKPVIVVHGGAWAIPDELSNASIEGVKAAACAGFAVLKKGVSALDAVEAAVRALEDNPVFDSGESY